MRMPATANAPRDWRRERFLVVEPREEPAISLPIESTTAAAH
jgi:hypothetical protein